ncbi:NADH-quinone oxidoreductase subunit M [Phycicoccus sp. CSK15P-2]|uniref:NADH-quinone oxidoreductase subunit M n=1 Tax=Phycicoccus sp. CSK15P-2 TaxID=2807627 RepID=UPI0019518CB8|nr:NADH-quinone oxidoreductase subunit M [Phycicoccus sp. CSK15P-2]MBM6404923.1 NADH-quinone oxidoreductase subunit M [Phycicoccus sp. CSK15P-2]
MTSLPLLTLMMVVPLVGAVVVAALPAGTARLARPLALGASLVTLVLAVLAWVAFDSGSDEMFQLTETYSWIPQLGVSYGLGVDGIALALVVMAAILTPVCLLAAWDDVTPVPLGDTEDDFAQAEHVAATRTKRYFALMLVLEAFMVGVFAATDVFLFYVFFEAMLIPVYFLIGLFGGPRRQYAAVKFLLFSLAGGLVMLVSVIAVYFAGPGGEDGFLVQNLVGNVTGSPEALRWMFVGFFIAFAVKAPMWPVHTWLPDAATEARPATAVLLVGVLDKVGTYGMIRFCLQLFPEASQWATPVVLTLAVVSVVYGALLAIGQTDMMRLIAFTSISHFGFIVLGIFAMTSVGGAGSTLYMVNHGFSTAGLFLIAGFLVARGGSKRIPDYGGWQRVTPVLAGTFLVAGLSSLALPGLSSFVSEFLVLQGTFMRYKVAAVVAALGIVLAALYILLMYQRTMTGPKPSFPDDATPRDLSGREKWVVAPIIASFVVLGFYPKPVLDIVNPAVDTTMRIVGVTDPSAAAEASGSAK